MNKCHSINWSTSNDVKPISCTGRALHEGVICINVNIWHVTTNVDKDKDSGHNLTSKQSNWCRGYKKDQTDHRRSFLHIFLFRRCLSVWMYTVGQPKHLYMSVCALYSFFSGCVLKSLLPPHHYIDLTSDLAHCAAPSQSGQRPLPPFLSAYHPIAIPGLIQTPPCSACIAPPASASVCVRRRGGSECVGGGGGASEAYPGLAGEAVMIACRGRVSLWGLWRRPGAYEMRRWGL